MSAAAIVAICIAGTFGYCLTTVYIHQRLTWYLRQGRTYDPPFVAGMLVLFLPLGIAMLAVYASGKVSRDGIAPRSVRREQALKEREAEIARLERELGIKS